MGKNTRLVFTIVLAFLIMTPFVLGADFLEPIFSSFRGTDIGRTYNNYAPFIDAILYIWLFIALTKGVFKDKFPTAVATVMGIILGIAMTVFELNSEFNLGKLAPIAALIFFLIFGMFLFNMMKNFTNHTFAAISIAFLVMYSLIQWIAPKLVEWINQIGWLGAFLSLFYLVSIIGLIYAIFSLFKDIKSGEWGAARTSRGESGSDREYRRKQRDEEIRANRERKAAEKMFKLNGELNNINGNISRLERLEADIDKRDLTNRQVQIETLKELESILNNSWELQKKVQDAYSKISKPEYYSNPDFMRQIEDAQSRLSEFVNRIQGNLIKLQKAVKESVDLYSKEKLDVGGSIADYTTEIQKLNDNLVDMTNTLIKEAKQILENVDMQAGVKEQEDLQKLVKVQEETAAAIEQVKTIEKPLTELQASIHNLDAENLNQLESALSIAETNPSKDVSTLNKVLDYAGANEVAKVDQELKEKDAKTSEDGKNKTQQFISWASKTVHAGYRYLSGDSLRRIFENIRVVHLNLTKIVNELMHQESTMKKELNTEINNVLKTMNQVDQQMIQDMKITMDLIKQECETNLKTMQLIKTDLIEVLTKIRADLGTDKGITEMADYMQKLNHLKGDPRITSLSVHNKHVKKLLTDKIDESIKILDNLINRKPEDAAAKNVRQEYIKLLEKIITDLDNNIKAEMNIYAKVESNFKVDTELTKVGKINAPTSLVSPGTIGGMK